MVVRLAACVEELELAPAHSQAQLVPVHRRRVVGVDRPLHGRAELARVDDPVVAGGLDVAAHARRDVDVAHDRRPRPALALGLAQERWQAVGVVDVAVGVDRRVDGVLGVAANCVEAALVLPWVKRSSVDQH